jgi:hypothetical protein
MKKGNNIALLILVGVVIFIIVLGNNLGFFVITGTEKISRTYTTTQVEKGGTFYVTYGASSVSGMWGASIVDSLSCKDGSGNALPIDLSNPNGWKGAVTKKFVMTSEEGTGKSFPYQMPNIEGAVCTLAGTYQFGNKTVMSFPSLTVKTKACLTVADTNCDGIISEAELGVYITKWLNDEVSRDVLGTVIQSWAAS